MQSELIAKIENITRPLPGLYANKIDAFIGGYEAARSDALRAIAAWNTRAEGDANNVNRYLTALRRELRLIESDPDSTLSDGARRTIHWAIRNAEALKTSTGEGR